MRWGSRWKEEKKDAWSETPSQQPQQPEQHLPGRNTVSDRMSASANICPGSAMDGVHWHTAGQHESVWDRQHTHIQNKQFCSDSSALYTDSTNVKSDILYKLIKLPLILSQFVNQKPTVISIVLSYFHVYESADSSSDGSLSCSFSSSPTKNHNAAVHAGVCKRLYCPERFQQLCLQRSLLEKCDESILIRERRRPGQ